MTLRQSFFLNLSVIIIAVIIAVPLISLIGISFQTDLSGYTIHFLKTRGIDYFYNTGALVLLSVTGTILIGTSMAWLITRYDFPGKKLLSWLLILPIGTPAYVIAYAYSDITNKLAYFQFFGALDNHIIFLPEIYGLWGAGFVFSLALYPYVYLLARASFSEKGADVFEAARTLGCSPNQAFFKIILPLARPGLIAGSVLVAMEVLSDYGVTSYLGIPTFSVGILRAWFGADSIISAARISFMLLVITGTIFTLERMQRGKHDKRILVNALRIQRAVPLSGYRAWLMTLFAGLPLIFSLLIPILYFSMISFNYTVSDRLMNALSNSFFLAGIAAIFASITGLVCASILRSGSFLSRFSVRFISLGYMIPGAISALSLIISIGFLKNIYQSSFSSGILYFSSLATLIFAYQMRFISAAINPSEAVLAKIDPLIETTARTLGANTWKILTKIYIPLALKGISISFIFVFIEVLKELPATMILRPVNFETLAVLVHTYASDERLHQAAFPSLVLMLSGLIPLIIIIYLSRWFNQKIL